MASRTRKSAAFTLVELLVVVAIIALLIGILLPSLLGARRAAGDTVCASNMRQVCLALLNYASAFKGRFPANALSAPSGGEFEVWLQPKIIGPFIGGEAVDPAVSGSNWTKDLHGGAFACPRDEDSVRTYAMNIFASGRTDVTKNEYTPKAFMGPHVPNASKTILLVENLSVISTPRGYMAYWHAGIFNQMGITPGQWFGAAGGVLSTWGPPPMRWFSTTTTLNYMNHRRPSDGGSGWEPVGRMNIGYCDGHVEMKRHRELYNPDGRSTFDSLWSPEDHGLERPAPSSQRRVD
jgi:prepilin-type N-terminal cleavage/methylation domain-containing protein/prepilin-type processing-associated H-X9-DG protein